MMAPSARTRTRWHKAHAPRASAAATSVRESRNTASRRARLSKPASAIARCSGEARNGWLRRAEETLLLPLPCSPSSSRSTGCHRRPSVERRGPDSRNAGRVGHDQGQGSFLPPGVNGKTVHSDILITGAHIHSSAALPGQARGQGNRTPSISRARTIVRRNERP